ncbi:SDR family oxidoreductase [Dyella sp.]|uniref:SDR family oxidoreductase n=1 Tax=Dyella sp. TaxID=1869338 RepID=UPI002D76AAEE|nr:SDR family oxidoreductase [Dyella sp.]HET7330832.1 SDR family oxidoreductase [Dyella sp.]
MTRKPEVVVITGASAGVGRATAQRFAKDGARVALLARDNPALEHAANEVRELGGTALPIALDVSDAAQVEAAAERIEQELGPIDIWINSAMATVFAPVSETPAEEFRRATEVTYLGTVHGTLAALKRMRSRNRGSIVQVGSALAYRAIPLQAAYCGAKFAIRGFTDALRVELLHDRSKVHVTMVQLSAFNTPQFEWARNRLHGRPQPVPPIFQPELAAKGVHWAAHHRRREVCVGFPAVKAIAINKWFPSLVDRVLARKGYQGQVDMEPVPEERPDNLFDAAPVDYGTHGRFDARAKSHSMQWWLTSNRNAVLLGIGALAAVAFSRRMPRNPLRREM